jgi:hypothetical protein
LNVFPSRKTKLGCSENSCKCLKALCIEFSMSVIDLSPFEWNFDICKSAGQKFHHSLKEHHKISTIPKFRCEML